MENTAHINRIENFNSSENRKHGKVIVIIVAIYIFMYENVLSYEKLYIENLG